MSQSKSKLSTKRSRRKRSPLVPLLVVLGGVALVALAVWSFASRNPGSKAAIEVNGSPSLRVDQEKVDLGDVRLGEWVSVSFNLTNVGDETLRFQRDPYIEVVEGC